MDSMPEREMRTISPGSISRTYCALSRSKAHVSDATSQASPTLPRLSGRTPSRARAERPLSTTGCGVCVECTDFPFWAAPVAECRYPVEGQLELDTTRR